MDNATHPTILTLAVCALETQAGSAVQLLPAGEFRAVDGRPAKLPAWRVDAAIAAELIAKSARRATELVIDYEHQTLHTESNGQPAPAAGWITSLEWRDGSGLWARVRWTERARSMIQAGEYRYISPVFEYHPKTGAVQGILHAALTNNPALDGLSEVALRAAARLQPHRLDNPMDLSKLREALGLAKEADEAAVNTALAALTKKAKETDEALKAAQTEIVELKKKLEAATAAAKSESRGGVEAAAPQSGTPDPAQYAPVSVVQELQASLAALSQKMNGSQVDELVKAGLKEGKLLPPMESWARDLGGRDMTALKAYLDAAAPVAALVGTQTGGKPPVSGASNPGGLSDSELAICNSLGVAPEEFAKHRTPKTEG